MFKITHGRLPTYQALVSNDLHDQAWVKTVAHSRQSGVAVCSFRAGCYAPRFLCNVLESPRPRQALLKPSLVIVLTFSPAIKDYSVIIIIISNGAVERFAS